MLWPKEFSVDRYPWEVKVLAWAQVKRWMDLPVFLGTGRWQGSQGGTVPKGSLGLESREDSKRNWNSYAQVRQAWCMQVTPTQRLSIGHAAQEVEWGAGLWQGKARADQVA